MRFVEIACKANLAIDKTKKCAIIKLKKPNRGGQTKFPNVQMSHKKQKIWRNTL